MPLIAAFQSRPFIGAWWDWEEKAPHAISGHQEKATVVSFLIRPQRGLTARLTKESQLHSINVDGPYGQDLQLEQYDTVILVAEGIGIAGVLPYAKYLSQRKLDDDNAKSNPKAKVCLSRDQTRKVDIFWKLEHNRQVSIAEKYLDILEKMDRKRLLAIYSYFPESKGDSTLSSSKHRINSFPDDPVPTESIGGLLKKEFRAPGRSIVIACGPPALSKCIRSIVTTNITSANLIEFVEVEYRPGAGERCPKGAVTITEKLHNAEWLDDHPIVSGKKDSRSNRVVPAQASERKQGLRLADPQAPQFQATVEDEHGENEEEEIEEEEIEEEEIEEEEGEEEEGEEEERPSRGDDFSQSRTAYLLSPPRSTKKPVKVLTNDVPLSVGSSGAFPKLDPNLKDTQKFDVPSSRTRSQSPTTRSKSPVTKKRPPTGRRQPSPKIEPPQSRKLKTSHTLNAKSGIATPGQEVMLELDQILSEFPEKGVEISGVGRGMLLECRNGKWMDDDTIKKILDLNGATPKRTTIVSGPEFKSIQTRGLKKHSRFEGMDRVICLCNCRPDGGKEFNHWALIIFDLDRIRGKITSIRVTTQSSLKGYQKGIQSQARKFLDKSLLEGEEKAEIIFEKGHCLEQPDFHACAVVTIENAIWAAWGTEIPPDAEDPQHRGFFKQDWLNRKRLQYANKLFKHTDSGKGRREKKSSPFSEGEGIIDKSEEKRPSGNGSQGSGSETTVKYRPKNLGGEALKDELLSRREDLLKARAKDGGEAKGDTKKAEEKSTAGEAEEEPTVEIVGDESEGGDLEDIDETVPPLNKYDSPEGRIFKEEELRFKQKKLMPIAISILRQVYTMPEAFDGIIPSRIQNLRIEMCETIAQFLDHRADLKAQLPHATQLGLQNEKIQGFAVQAGYTEKVLQDHFTIPERLINSFIPVREYIDLLVRLVSYPNSRDEMAREYDRISLHGQEFTQLNKLPVGFVNSIFGLGPQTKEGQEPSNVASGNGKGSDSQAGEDMEGERGEKDKKKRDKESKKDKKSEKKKSKDGKDGEKSKKKKRKEGKESKKSNKSKRKTKEGKYGEESKEDEGIKEGEATKEGEKDKKGEKSKENKKSEKGEESEDNKRSKKTFPALKISDPKKITDRQWLKVRKPKYISFHPSEDKSIKKLLSNQGPRQKLQQIEILQKGSSHCRVWFDWRDGAGEQAYNISGLKNRFGNDDVLYRVEQYLAKSKQWKPNSVTDAVKAFRRQQYGCPVGDPGIYQYPTAEDVERKNKKSSSERGKNKSSTSRKKTKSSPKKGKEDEKSAPKSKKRDKSSRKTKEDKEKKKGKSSSKAKEDKKKKDKSSSKAKEDKKKKDKSSSKAKEDKKKKDKSSSKAKEDKRKKDKSSSKKEDKEKKKDKSPEKSEEDKESEKKKDNKSASKEKREEKPSAPSGENPTKKSPGKEETGIPTPRATPNP
ncbi:hypothetical protein EG329_003768 [Mollisiaceae sp. DMI_Dod_QoI]|nr:hypothetical protein EG329_003768 [Helotiales sp. DMI_Dod_QoI]